MCGGIILGCIVEWGGIGMFGIGELKGVWLGWLCIVGIFDGDMCLFGICGLLWIMWFWKWFCYEMSWSGLWIIFVDFLRMIWW